MKAYFLLLGLFIFSIKTAWGEPSPRRALNSADARSYLYFDANLRKHSFQSDTILDHIQHKIEQAMELELRNKEARALSALERKVEQVKNNELASYWMAYIQYLKARDALWQKEHKAAQQADEKGIKILEEKTFKNADDYALLALLKGLSFYFAPESEGARIYMEIERLLYSGFALDKNNIRLHFAKGLLDFHTPQEYGGGKKTEEFMLQAISLPETNSDNPQRPTWGKEDAYAILIQHYLRADKKQLAEKYFKEGKFVFPNSRSILYLQGSF